MKPNEPGRNRLQGIGPEAGLRIGRKNGRKIGLFGGTFNPIHMGHISAARDVVRRVDLDHIYLIPSAVPPHKSSGKLAPAAQRLEMVRLALGKPGCFSASDVEVNRSGPSYTIDTVRYFRGQIPADGELFFILGLDAFLDMHTWKAFDDLLNEVAVVVMSRPGAGLWTADTLARIQTYVENRLGVAYSFSRADHRFVHPDKKEILLVSVRPVDIASSRIRTMIRSGRSVADWVPPAVAEYIQTRGLYR